MLTFKWKEKYRLRPFLYTEKWCFSTSALLCSFFRMLLWVQNFLLINPGLVQWTEKDTVYLVSFFFPQSLCYMATSSLRKQLMTLLKDQWWSPPWPRTRLSHTSIANRKQSIELLSFEEEDTLDVLPSALVPRITESTHSPAWWTWERSSNQRSFNCCPHRTSISTGLQSWEPIRTREVIRPKSTIRDYGNRGLGLYSQSMCSHLPRTGWPLIHSVCAATCVSLVLNRSCVIDR